MRKARDDEFWELSTTNAWDGWDQVRIFDRLDDACCCIIEMEGVGVRKLDLQTVASVIDPHVTGIVLLHDGKRMRYRIRNCCIRSSGHLAHISTCIFLQVKIWPRPPAGGPGSRERNPEEGGFPPSGFDPSWRTRVVRVRICACESCRFIFLAFPQAQSALRPSSLARH